MPSWPRCKTHAVVRSSILAFKTRIGLKNRPIRASYGEERRQFSVFVYIVVMAQIPQISSISKLHGTTARVIEFAITIKTITPKTITKR
ncbi:hypothetical protein OKW43_001121 [Paraburkholderia sp. WC7.3g]|uniref:Uncharacterized protein n=1 Tax=Paraburkholderia podalyriae TaxID=1938811 RepID=A0ABR7PWD9_9BURK|nr:hypothetical protein [Paraburkholderia podalyriae]MBC8750599.1 hypothetical protein [Paraburkholderia podalyriae]